MVNLFQMNQKMKIMKIDGIPKIIMKVLKGEVLWIIMMLEV